MEMVSLGSEDSGEHKAVLRILKDWNKGEGVGLFGIFSMYKIKLCA